MDIDVIFKIAGVGIVTAILNQVLARSDKSEYAMVITLTGIVIVFLMIIPQIKELFDVVKDFIEF